MYRDIAFNKERLKLFGASAGTCIEEHLGFM